MSTEHHEDRTFTPALVGLIWTAMFGFSGFFLSYATIVTISVGAGLSTVTGGSLLTTMMIGVIVTQPFAPAIERRLGTREAVLVAIGLQVLGQVIAFVGGPPLISLAIAGVCGGVGFGLLVVLTNAAVPGTTAPRNLGKALGYFGSVTSLAAAFGSPFGLWLVGAVPVPAFRAVACLMLLIAVPTVVLFLPDRNGRRRGGLRRGGAHRSDARQGDAATGGTTGPADADIPVRGPAATPRRRRTPGGVVRLLIMLAPFLSGMVIFGIIVGFGPGTAVAAAAVFIGLMQVLAVVGRFVAGLAADHFSPRGLNLVGVGITIAGLIVTAFSVAGWTLAIAMILVGLGLGTMQSASLVLAFNEVSTAGRASVAWNMHFDIGLAIAGVVGGLGFTYLGDSQTFLVCAGFLVLTGVLAAIFRPTHRVRAR